MAKAEVIGSALFAEMQAELKELSKTEPGARDVVDVVRDLLPLIRGCRDRGHSWKRIAESLQKHHSGLSVGRLRKYAFELDPSLKGGSPGTQKSLIPEMDQPEGSQGSLLDDSDTDDKESIDSSWPPEVAKGESSGKKKSGTKKSAALDFEDDDL